MNPDSLKTTAERADVDACLTHGNACSSSTVLRQQLMQRALLGRIDAAAEEDPELALRQAEQLIVSACGHNHANALLEGLLIKAYLLLKNGQNDKGIETLRQGLLLGGAAPPASAAPFDAADGEMINRPVWIHTLGRFEILIDGRPLQVAAKVPKKPLELLRALIAMSGRAVEVKALLLQVWPKDGASARSSFDVALMRLRKLLGHADALLLEQGKLTLNQSKCWVDVWSFEHAMTRFDASVVSGALTESLELYRGDFLPECQVPCIVNMRDRLASKFQRAMLRLGRVYEAAERWDLAVSIYRRGLEQDNLAEEFYRRLMYCEWQRGHMIEAVKTYRRCCQVLSVNLQIKPSDATEALYRRVTAN